MPSRVIRAGVFVCAHSLTRKVHKDRRGRLGWAEAEHLALEDTVDIGLACHPALPTSDQAGCAHCGGCERDGDALLPVLARDGHTWVHDGCWPAWLQSRRARAREVLSWKGVPGSRLAPET